MTTDANLLDRLTHQLDQPALSIDGLCLALGVSRSTLARVVKEQIGLSLALYIRQYRLHTAKTLLETTDLRVAEIADRVGFTSSQDLSRYFTAAFGRSPSEYRLLTGRVQQPGNRVNVSVELVQVENDRTLWANHFAGQTREAFGFMSQTARQVADELNRQLSQLGQQHLSRAPTQHTEAYNQYLKGHYLLRDRTELGLRESIRRFDKVIALDSTFADAWASRGQAYYLYGIEGYAPTSVY